MGRRTFFEKTPSTKFIVKNIALNNKTVRVFNTPIRNRGTYDLLNIAEISEADIRHSLLKGELLVKFLHNELVIVDTNINLLQFDATHKAFLIEHGANDGLEIGQEGPETAGAGFYFHQNIALIGVKNSSNRVFVTPENFLNESIINNDFSIRIRHNGQTLVEDENYILSESEGSGTGFDTVTFISFKPKSDDTLIADYTTET